jgi:hypothetical protein
MVAGLTSRPWSVEELFEKVMRKVDAQGSKRRTPPEKSGGTFAFLLTEL